MKTLRQFGIISLIALAGQSASAAGIPQMDQSWYPNQLLWLAVSFVLLYTIVSRFIAPRVGAVLEDRERAIADAIAEAEKAKLAAESTKGNFESAGAGARAKAAEYVAAAQAENTRNAADALAKLDHELARKTEQAQARIDDAVAKAQKGLGESAASLAGVMVEKLLAQSAAMDVPVKAKRLKKA